MPRHGSPSFSESCAPSLDTDVTSATHKGHGQPVGVRAFVCYGFRKTTLAFMIPNSSRRFVAQAASLCAGSSGRSLPYDTASTRPASIPWLTRYCLAVIARRLPKARLYSSEPRSSQFPAMRIRSEGLT